MSCPYCGNSLLKQVIPKKDRVKSVKVDAGADTYGSLGVEVDLWENPYPRSHIYCDSCNKSYSKTSLDGQYIIQNSRLSDQEDTERIANLVRHYYHVDGITLSKLILNHCTGIVRPYRTKIPYITEKFLRQKLHVCFNYNNQRTYLTLTKKAKKMSNYRIEYYIVDSLVMSI